MGGEQKTQVRGGIGIFSGRTPFVWISNQFGNTGMTLSEYSNYGDFVFNPDPHDQPEIDPNRTAEVNLIDENYRFPQVFRTNIAIDKELWMGFTGTVEFIYSKSMDEIKYQNINIEQEGVNSKDGRPMFGSVQYAGSNRFNVNRVDWDFYDVMFLTNTDEGFNYTLSFQLQKEFESGGMINTSYTYGMSKDLFSGTSSQAKSNWKYNPTEGDPNNPPLTYSSHDTRHRIVFAISKKFQFFPNAPTTLAMFYQGRSGRPYSTIYDNDYNGDGQYNDCIYVPATEDDIELTEGSSWADLDAYISADPELDKYRGQIAPRNVSRDPWTHQVDIKITQGIPIPGLKGHKLELSLNVENFLNIFNKDWGVVKYIQFNDQLLKFQGHNDAGEPTFSFEGDNETDDARYNINQTLSRWRLMFGVRYKF
ncbi:MAG: TonB-dependent receptor, partial [bacterium]|nr:TonB-dependent receptor [bacterium]